MVGNEILVFPLPTQNNNLLYINGLRATRNVHFQPKTRKWQPFNVVKHFRGTLLTLANANMVTF